MKHHISPEDDRFRSAFEALQIEPGEFDHAAHVRLAYVYLWEGSVESALARMKRALLAFLAHLGVGDSKYHATMTRAWVMAVDHFMNRTEACSSCADLTFNPSLRRDRGRWNNRRYCNRYAPLAGHVLTTGGVRQHAL